MRLEVRPGAPEVRPGAPGAPGGAPGGAPRCAQVRRTSRGEGGWSGDLQGRARSTQVRLVFCGDESVRNPPRGAFLVGFRGFVAGGVFLGEVVGFWCWAP